VFQNASSSSHVDSVENDVGVNYEQLVDDLSTCDVDNDDEFEQEASMDMHLMQNKAYRLLLDLI
jgi:hypothetical protein